MVVKRRGVAILLPLLLNPTPLLFRLLLLRDDKDAANDEKIMKHVMENIHAGIPKEAVNLR